MRQLKKILFWMVLLALYQLMPLSLAGEVEISIHVAPVPPYVIDGVPRGIACDMIERAFATQQRKVRFIISNNKRMETEVRQKNSDAGFVGIPRETTDIYFSDSVIDYQNIFVSLRKNQLELKQITDLADKKIIAFRNARRLLGPDFANLIENKPDGYFEVGDQRSQIPMLDAGRGDVIVLEQRAFQFYALQMYPAYVIQERYTIHALLPAIPRYLGFHNQQLRDVFNLGLKEIIKTGEYNEIIKRYLRNN